LEALWVYPCLKCADYPFVSVIIPTYNRRAILEKCLSALLVQTYPHDKCEIIVIDDGSTDGTGEMIGRLVEEYGLTRQSIIVTEAEAEVKREVEPVAGIEDRAEAEIEDKTEVRTKAETDTECRHGVKRCVTCRSRRLIYEWQEHTSAAAARNRGIRKAVGDLVILLDSDIGEDHDPETQLIPLVLMTALGLRPELKVFGRDYDTPDGTCVRDYIHVSDLASAHVLAAEALVEGLGSRTYNLGNGQGYTVRQVIETARRITGREIPAVDAPRRPGDPAVLVASSDRIKDELGWTPRFPDLEDIIGTAWEWHRRHPHGYCS
jgi:glycosyltransferase involved in cell wall biosynthesis